MVDLGKASIEDLVKNAWESEAAGHLYMAEAQVRATQELANQQRIANLIALGQFRIGAHEAPPLRHLVVEAVGEWDLRPREQIREGLGLE